MRRKVSGTSFQRETVHGGIYQNSYAKCFFFTYFLPANIILHLETYQAYSPGKIFKGIEIVWEIFPWGGGGNFLREKPFIETLGGENIQGTFSRREDFRYDLKNN